MCCISRQQQKSTLTHLPTPKTKHSKTHFQKVQQEIFRIQSIEIGVLELRGIHIRSGARWLGHVLDANRLANLNGFHGL